MGRAPKKSTSATQPAAAPGQREAILAAAVTLFSGQGYNGTTMRDIASAVGILPGSLYAHIASKEILLSEIVLDGQDRFLALESQVKKARVLPQERLRQAIKAHVATVAEYPERSLVVFHQWRFLSEPNRERSLEKRRRYVKHFRDMVKQAVESREFDSELDIRVSAFAVLGAMNWTPEWFSVRGPDSAEEIGEALARSIILGLKVRDK